MLVKVRENSGDLAMCPYNTNTVLFPYSCPEHSAAIAFRCAPAFPDDGMPPPLLC